MEKKQRYLREVALNALKKAIHAVGPQKLIEKAIRIQDNQLIIQDVKYDLQKFKKILIIGGGKATAEMTYALERILKNFTDINYEGVINTPKRNVKHEKTGRTKTKLNYASHPIPDKNGLKGTKMMIEIVEKSGKDDLIICLISGGGSALLPLPKEGINLQDLQIANSLLLASGASIHEINAVRKHLSDFKGGNLAKKVYNTSKAILISLIISDVVGDKLDSIASGPSVPDLTTFDDAIQILKKYDIYQKVPPSITHHLEEGLLDENLETPKFNNECFNNVHNYIIGSVKSAVEELIPFLEMEGFESSYFSDKIVGEAQRFGKSLNTIISQKLKETATENTPGKIALIGTGELTVTIKGTGIGGRNQEMLLSFLEYIKGKEIPYEFLIIGANLDGIEGNSEATGALIDNYVLNQIYKKDIKLKNYLENNDSNSFFKLVGTDIITGSTGCNVNDLLIILLQINK
ncbi:MAG: glycerate kinase type-2 family protein [Promethearchaeota archaeon]